MKSSKRLKQENTILNKDNIQTKCDNYYDEDEPYGRLVYNSDLVHYSNKMQIMRVILEIP